MSPSIWRAAVVIRLALIVACWPAMAHAADAVDDAVDAVVTVGRIGGVAIAPAEAPTVKALVRCALQGRVMLDCARVLVIDQLPHGVQPVAHCMVLGIALNACASPDTLRTMPISARAAARCIGERSAIGTCSGLIAIHPQQRQTFRVIDKLRADGRYDDLITAAPAMRRLVQLAEAMRISDWDEVARVGGPEVYKVALRGAAKARARQA